MSNVLKALARGGAVGDYEISRSLRFNPADSAHATRTFASVGDRKTWTWSAWVKLGAVTGDNTLFAANASASAISFVTYSSALRFVVDGTYGGTRHLRRTTAVYRDPSAWYHIVVALDTTQATDTNRIKAYINGEQVALDVAEVGSWPAQNSEGSINNNIEHCLGERIFTDDYKYNGYMADINFVDGQALTPSDFGETDETTGVWKPIAYAGTYGTNGFHLPFSDNSDVTATTLGKDTSGNGNNWTPNNFSVTAGAGNDSLVDTPTPYGTDTGAGGEVRGNYCTFNAVAVGGGPILNGNLDIASSSYAGLSSIYGTIGVSSGKWYWEVTAQNSLIVGVGSAALTSTYPGQSGVSCGWNVFFDITSAAYVSGGITNSASSGSGSAASAGDVIGVALDMDAGSLYLYKNGTVLNAGNPVFTTISGNMMPAFRGPDTNTSICNFGQRPFAYTAPSGFKALCTTNLPEPTVLQGNDYFNTVLYTGNGTTNAITGVGFQPDFVWGKSRSNAYNHALYDILRGAQQWLSSSTTSAEGTYPGVTAFNSDGFSLGNDAGTNNSGSTYVAWNWNAGGSNATNTDGTITSTVRANPTAGFSIVGWDSSGSNATVGHGLGAAPVMIIARRRNTTENWIVYHQNMGGNNGYLLLNSTAAFATNADPWNSTDPTSTVLSYNNAAMGAGTGNPMIAYVFAEVPGYSAFGSYTGNGSTDGPFVYTGFRPRWIMLKIYSGATDGWVIYDTARNTYNVANLHLYPNSSQAEAVAGSTFYIDILSNGFKIRGADGLINGNTYAYIFAAFAENPFKNSLAR